MIFPISSIVASCNVVLFRKEQNLFHNRSDLLENGGRKYQSFFLFWVLGTRRQSALVFGERPLRGPSNKQETRIHGEDTGLWRLASFRHQKDGREYDLRCSISRRPDVSLTRCSTSHCPAKPNWRGPKEAHHRRLYWNNWVSLFWKWVQPAGRVAQHDGDLSKSWSMVQFLKWYWPEGGAGVQQNLKREIFLPCLDPSGQRFPLLDLELNIMDSSLSSIVVIPILNANHRCFPFQVRLWRSLEEPIPIGKDVFLLPVEGFFALCVHAILSATWPRRPLWYGSSLIDKRPRREPKRWRVLLTNCPSWMHSICWWRCFPKYNYISVISMVWTKVLGTCSCLRPQPVGCLVVAKKREILCQWSHATKRAHHLKSLK